MGMMLETTANRLYRTTGAPHFGSPDKDPAVRLRVLEDAGRSNVPFTTGILIGIGETRLERAESIYAIRKVAREYGGIQEVIVQNFRAKPRTAMAAHEDLGLQEYIAAVAVTRLLLGPAMRVQAPPNLSDTTELGLLRCDIAASQLTKAQVQLAHAQALAIGAVRAVLQAHGEDPVIVQQWRVDVAERLVRQAGGSGKLGGRTAPSQLAPVA